MDEEKNAGEGTSSEGSTGDSGMVSPPIEEPEVEAVSTGAALTGVLVSPTETYDRMAKGKPSWNFLVPLLLLLLVAIGAKVNFVNRVDLVQMERKQIIQSPFTRNMSPEQIDQSAKAGAKIEKFKPYFLAIGIPLWFLIVSFVYWLILMAMGEKLFFRNVFRVICWGNLPTVIHSLVFLILPLIMAPNLIDPNNPVMSNPGAILGSDKLGMPLYALLSSLDIFGLWTLFLYATGFAAFAGAKKSKMIWIVFGLYAFFILIIFVVMSIIY